jgi:SOS-response transcriptional repressor LexA
MVGKIMKDRIERRLVALGITQFEAGELAGRDKNFIYDLMVGRKRAIKGRGLAQVASALQCTVEYLTGASDDPGGNVALARALPKSGMPVAGVIEPGVFRLPSERRGQAEHIPIDIDRRFHGVAQSAYLVRGNSLSAIGIVEGMFLTAIPVTDYPHGGDRPPPLVVLECTTRDGLIELSARERLLAGGVISYGGEITVDPSGKISRHGISIHSVNERGIIVRAVRLL